MRASLLERSHQQKPGTWGFRKSIQTAHNNKKKKNSLRIKKPFRVGQRTFRIPLGRGASLSHSGVQTTDALRNAQESSHARFPPSGHLHRLTCLPGTLPTKLFRWGFTQGSGWQSQVNAAESLFRGSIPGFHWHSLTCPSTSCGWHRVVPTLGQALPLPLPPQLHVPRFYLLQQNDHKTLH